MDGILRQEERAGLLESQQLIGLNPGWLAKLLVDKGDRLNPLPLGSCGLFAATRWRRREDGPRARRQREST